MKVWTVPDPQRYAEWRYPSPFAKWFIPYDVNASPLQQLLKAAKEGKVLRERIRWMEDEVEDSPGSC